MPGPLLEFPSCFIPTIALGVGLNTLTFQVKKQRLRRKVNKELTRLNRTRSLMDLNVAEGMSTLEDF